ncbi:MAG TPA: thioredoxin domain-containing protein [Myxococcales bacterium]
MKNAWNVAVAACVSGAIGYFVGVQMHSGGSVGTPLRAENRAAAQQPPLPPGSEVVYKVPVGPAPVKGDPEAKVIIVEFSDFECPFCGRAIEVVKQVESRYGKDVRLAFKHNPLPMHPDAPYAARAAIAAGKQGKFWQMHDKLFEANVARTPNGLKPDRIDQMARDLGLDLDRFHRDAESQEAKDQVEADQAQARALGATGTPYFYVNGQRIAGAQPFEQFKVVVDAALKRADAALAKGVPRKDLYETLVKDGQAGPPAPPPQPPPAAQAHNVDLGTNSPWTGAKHAKVTIVEFSDFQCPFCQRAEPTLQKILETYKGDVKLVWRNEPLSFHPNALPAAKAAMAAHKQGKFWQMHALMFQHQNELSEAKYEEWAKQIGVDLSRWRKDKELQEIASAIDADSRYANQVGADGTPAFFINGRLISGAMPFETFKPVIDEQIEKANAALKKGVKPEKLYEVLVAQNVQSAGQAEQQVAAKIEVGNAPVLGPKNAPVTIVEWSDFQCPFCGRVEPTLQQLREQYQGKIRFAWKNQPLSFHPNAMPAAEAAMAAHEQGKFWEFHDALFKKQGQLGPALYDEVGRQLGLDMDRFHAAIQARKHAAHIQADMAAGNAVGAQGTPTFFINGKMLIGAQPIDAFKQLIDAELAAAVAKR